MKELYSKLGHCWGAEDTKYKQELQAHKQELPYMWFLQMITSFSQMYLLCEQK